MQAFILSAGLGTRLLPITNYIPKPLLPIGKGMPLLRFIIENLRNHGFDSFVVNTHHLSERFVRFKTEFYPHDAGISLIREEEILDTGGGISNAREFLTEENFLLHNGDIYVKPSYRKFKDFHEEKRGVATLLLGKLGNKNVTAIGMDESGLIVSVGNVCRRGYRRRRKGGHFYTGVQFLNREVFQWLPEGNRESLTELLLYRWLRDDVPFYGFSHDGIWSDIGNPQEYMKLNFLLNKTRGYLDYSENTTIKDGVRLEKVIILNNSTIVTNLKRKIVISSHIEANRNNSLICI